MGEICSRNHSDEKGIACVVVNEGRNIHSNRNSTASNYKMQEESIDQEEKRESEMSKRTSKSNKPVGDKEEYGTNDTLILVENVFEESQMPSEAKMVDQFRDHTSDSVSCRILEPGSNLSDRNKSYGLENAGRTVGFTDEREDELDTQKKELNQEIKMCEKDEIIKKEQIKLVEEDKHRQELEVLMKEFNEERRRYIQELQINKDKIKQLEEGNNELLNRLSSLAAARITYNNPNITDLSDQNRPTKISELYSELYDNQWTDAFENLQTKHHLSDTEAIQFLLDVLYTSFDECKEARKQREGFLHALKSYIGVGGDDQDVTIQEVMRMLKGTRRNIKDMQKTFKENAEKRLVTVTNGKEKLQDIRLYMDECVEICLLMNIQEPPMELYRFTPLFGASFDGSAFRPYTESGNIIEYIVWPALYLYQDGPLLLKGVAQGKCSSFNVEELTSVKDDANKKEFTPEACGQHTDAKDNSVYVLDPNDINVSIEKNMEALKESSSSTDLRSENSFNQSQGKTEKQYDKPDSSQYTDASRMDATTHLTMTTLEHLARTVQKENVQELQIILGENETDEITYL